MHLPGAGARATDRFAFNAPSRPATSGVKLTSRLDLVKPDPLILAVAAFASVVTIFAVQLVLLATDRAEARMDRFGAAAARALAELAVEPLMRQDRLHLGVIGNRLAETDEIRGVASYSSDDQLLATAGEMDGPQYSEPVVLDDSIVGYVRLALHPAAFAESGRERSLGLLLAALLVPLLVASGWTLARAAGSGALAAALFRGALQDSMVGATDEIAAVPDPQPLPAPAVIRHYLLAANLYNQLTLPPNEREFELSLCLELAEAVANVYHGQVVRLPGVGVLVDFDHTEDESRAFEVLTAAFVLNRLLQDEAPFGHYRLGLNLVPRPADEALPLDDPGIGDAALLSALARDGTLAVSEPFARALAGDDRYLCRPLVNPLLDELSTSASGCLLVTGLAPPIALIVAQRAEQLKTQRDDAISSPSTL